MLELGTLKKYKRYHRIKITHSTNKKELAEAVTQHFVQQHIDEDTVINAFVAHVKCTYPLLSLTHKIKDGDIL